MAGLRASEIKDIVVSKLFDGEPVQQISPEALNNFEARFKTFAAFRSAKGTRVLYDRIWIMLEKFATEQKIKLGALVFEDIDLHWLRDFEKFLAKTSPSKNARNIHLRNIRAVFNDALDDEVITCYPFRKFKIKGEETRKRALSVKKLWALFALELDKTNQRYVDFLKLTFLLCGINVFDLCNTTDFVDGRFEYQRAKTHRFSLLRLNLKQWC